MAQYQHLPIYKQTYDILLRTMVATKDFPREYKFTLGQKLKDELIELVVLIYRANLNLHLHHKKKHLNLADKGIDFTGFIIKPGRAYLRQATVDHCKQKIRAWERKGAPIDPESLKDLSEGVNSYLGMLRQVSGYNARKKICKRVESLFLLSDAECTKIKPTT